MKSHLLQIHMLSDWRIGSGTGRQGAVDGLVVRDVNGLPYIPSTTLRGVWRDAAETLAHGLDEGQAGGGWARLVSHLFGNQPALESENALTAGPVSAALLVDDARFPDVMGRYFNQGKNVAREAFTFVKSGVSIDPENGRAKQDYLKFDEIARAGAELVTTVSLESSGDATFDMVAEAFALASLRLVERIGGDRRRGAGRCEITVTPVKVGEGDAIDAAIAILASTETAPVPQKEHRSRATFAYGDGKTGTEALIMPLNVTIESPTNIARRVEGNVATTQDYIPGTMLISAAHRIATSNGVADEAFLPALAAGRIRILNAYPSSGGERGRPVPVVLEERKDNFEGPFLANGKRRGKIRRRLSELSTEQFKALRSGYCLTSPGAQGLELVASGSKMLRTQNAVDDQRQKPTEDAGGGVYVMEVLVPGTVLASAIVIDRSLVKNAGKMEAEFTTRVGRAKNAGFGRIKVKVGAEDGRAATGGTGLTLLVASDLVLPPPSGRTPVEQIAMLLRERGIEYAISKEKSDLRFRRHDGWISAWGLPRPTLTTVSAGSVIELEGTKIDAAAAKALSLFGLGLRCGEGYGEIVVNPEILAEGARLNPESGAKKPESGEETIAHTPIESKGLSATQVTYLKAVETAAVLDVIRTFAELAAADENVRSEKLGWKTGNELLPPMSQLGVIRGLIDPTSEAPDFRKAIAFLNKIGQVERRAKKWREDGGALSKLNTLLSTPTEVWPMIEASQRTAFGAALNQALTVSEVAEAKKNVASKAASEFLYAAIRQHKRASENEKKG